MQGLWLREGVLDSPLLQGHHALLDMLVVWEEGDRYGDLPQEQKEACLKWYG